MKVKKEKVCPICDGKGWYFVDEWIGSLQGRKDCACKTLRPGTTFHFQSEKLEWHRPERRK